MDLTNMYIARKIKYTMLSQRPMAKTNLNRKGTGGHRSTDPERRLECMITRNTCDMCTYE